MGCAAPSAAARIPARPSAAQSPPADPPNVPPSVPKPAAAQPAPTAAAPAQGAMGASGAPRAPVAVDEPSRPLNVPLSPDAASPQLPRVNSRTSNGFVVKDNALTPNPSPVKQPKPVSQKSPTPVVVRKVVVFDQPARQERSDSSSFRERFGAISAPEENNLRLEDVYDVDAERIGRGHYASVYRATNRATGERVAVKMIDKRVSKHERLNLEIQAMKKAGGHPNIVKLIDVFETPTHVILVLELVEGGELFDHLVQFGQYSESDAARIMRSIVSAVAFLHAQDIVHRDLKPENILLTSKGSDAIIKIADFGLAKLMASTMTTVCGTWAYAAPEVKSKENRAYDAKVDMWSVGVIAFILLSGYHPFDPQGVSTDDEIWARIERGAYDFNDPVWKGVSLLSREFISRCLVIDPSVRWSAEEALEHRWLKPEEQPEIVMPIPRPRQDKFQKSRTVLNPLQKAALAVRARYSAKQVKKPMPDAVLKEVKDKAKLVVPASAAEASAAFGIEAPETGASTSGTVSSEKGAAGAAGVGASGETKIPPPRGSTDAVAASIASAVPVYPPPPSVPPPAPPLLQSMPSALGESPGSTPRPPEAPLGARVTNEAPEERIPDKEIPEHQNHEEDSDATRFSDELDDAEVDTEVTEDDHDEASGR